MLTEGAGSYVLIGLGGAFTVLHSVIQRFPAGVREYIGVVGASGSIYGLNAMSAALVSSSSLSESTEPYHAAVVVLQQLLPHLTRRREKTFATLAAKKGRSAVLLRDGIAVFLHDLLLPCISPAAALAENKRPYSCGLFCVLRLLAAD